MTTGRKLSYALALGIIAVAGLALTKRASGLAPIDHQPIATLREALKSSGQKRIAQGMQDVLAVDDKGQYVPAGAPLMLTTNTASNAWTVSVLDDKAEGSTVLIGNDLQKVSSDEIPSLPTFDAEKAKATLDAVNALGSGYYSDKIQELEKEEGCKRAFTGKVNYILKSALAMAWASHKYKHDNEIMKFKIDGEDIEIPRGKLSELMKKRVKELEAKEAGMRDASNDPEQVAQINAQLQKYEADDRATEARDQPPDFKSLTPAFFDLLVAPNGVFHVLAVDPSGACVEVAAGKDFAGNN